MEIGLPTANLAFLQVTSCSWPVLSGWRTQEAEGEGKDLLRDCSFLSQMSASIREMGKSRDGRSFEGWILREDGGCLLLKQSKERGHFGFKVLRQYSGRVNSPSQH